MRIFTIKTAESPNVRCCVCKKVKQNGQWVTRDDLPDRAENGISVFSHTYCPECLQKELAKIETKSDITFQDLDIGDKFTYKNSSWLIKISPYLAKQFEAPYELLKIPPNSLVTKT